MSDTSRICLAFAFKGHRAAIRILEPVFEERVEPRPQKSGLKHWICEV